MDTIISRCQYKFTVKKPTKEELKTLLKRVCKKEGVVREEKALGLICVKADFVPLWWTFLVRLISLEIP